jgi:hypothetical protein
MKRAIYRCDCCGHESPTRMTVVTMHDGGIVLVRRDVCERCAESVAALLRQKGEA